MWVGLMLVLLVYCSHWTIG